MPEDVPTPRPRFRVRVFISFGLFGSFFIAAIAGLALFLRPEGSLATWTGWRFLGVDKKGWEGIHTIFVGLLFVLAAIHIVLNRKPLWAYLRAKTGRVIQGAAELGTAVILLAVFLAAALNHWPPFWNLIEVRSDIKTGHYSVMIPPPAPEAEKLGLAQVCALAAVPFDAAVARLKAAGIEAPGPDSTLADLARTAGSTPERLFAVLRGRSD